MRLRMSIATIVALALPAPALAETITFDGLAPGTVLTTQYADVGGAGQGVTFGLLPGGVPSPTYRPAIIALPTGQAHSGMQAANISTCLSGIGCEFYIPRMTATFAVPRTTVSVRAGVHGAMTATAVATMTAYDAGGGLVATSAPVTLTAGAGIHALISVTAPPATIVGIRIDLRAGTDFGNPVAIDDLTFDTPVTPPVPDITLTPSSTFVTVRQGASLDIPVTVGRIGGSTGPVTLALTTPLPPGVTATIAPNPVPGDTSTLTLTAATDAPPTGGAPVAVTLRATPSAGAGSATREVTITVGVRSSFDLRVIGSADVDLSTCVASAVLEVDRDFGFPGPVNLTVTGLSGGVQASFAPPLATFPNGAAGEQIALVLTAPPTGFAVPNQTLTVHANAPGLAERTATITAHGTCPAVYDIRITSMQITQGAQSTFLPDRYPANPSAPFAYADIPNRASLIREGTTVVRVYANASIAPSNGVPGVTAELRAYNYDRFGRPVLIPGGPLLPISPPRRLKVGPASATMAEEVSDVDAFSFILPPSWVRGEMMIGVRLIGPSPGQTVQSLRQCEEAACVTNDAFAIGHIPITAPRTFTIEPVAMTVGGDPALPSAASVFDQARKLTPLKVVVKPYVATIDISDLSGLAAGSDEANSAVLDRLDDWHCDNEPSSGTFAIGVNSDLARGVKHTNVCFWNFSAPENAVVTWKRPLTSVAHEWGHLLGRRHASPGCGGGANGEVAEAWPPDEMGFLQSIGLDVNVGSGVGGPFRVIGGGPPLVPTQWFDYMSYCAGGATAWVSVKNWNALVAAHGFHALTPRAVTPPKERLLRVTATVAASGATTIGHVRTVSAPRPPEAVSDYRLIGRDALGAQVAEATMLSTISHVEGGPPMMVLHGYLPPLGTIAKVEVVRAGVVRADRTRSARAPRVEILSPRAGARLAGRNVTVRLRATDADGDALRIRLEYSRDAGRTWDTVSTGPARDRITLPGRLFARSSRARIRVTVSDGFRERTVTSARFSAAGAPPTVRISTPAAGLTQPNDAALILAGEATDDASRSITGRSLVWRSGSRILGRGATLAVTGLAAGSRRITLTARDRTGRSATTVVAVRLTAAKPVFLRLSAPKTLGRSRRTFRLTVASSLRGRLSVRIAGQPTRRFQVGRTVRTLAIRVPRGTATLNVHLTLTAGGRATNAVLTVKRP
jgi:hypothetical protein